MATTPNLTDEQRANLAKLAEQPAFPPERITQAIADVNGTMLAPIIRKAAEAFYEQVLATAEDYLRNNLDWNLSAHVQMLERENQRMRTELYEVDRFLGSHGLSSEGRMERLRELDAAVLRALPHRAAEPTQ